MPVNVFLSYSHRDERLLDSLRRHLKSLERSGLIGSWHDRKITAGSECAEAISNALESADIILLLVSENFLASDYCFELEMKRAMARHEVGDARVIPVILKACLWNNNPLFGKLQALPKDAKPITSWSNRNEAYTDVARGIQTAAKELGQGRDREGGTEYGDAASPVQAPSDADSDHGDVMPDPSGKGDMPSPPPAGVDWTLVDVHGTLYIARSRQERRCLDELSKPGMLIRIKSPDKMGKSMMMGRVLQQVRQEGYRTAVVDLREANQEIFADINQFLQWFCAYAADQIDIDKAPTEMWKSFLGPNLNATKYVEKVLLKPFDTPLVLAIDNFDWIFDRHVVYTDFCGLLRGWFERVNTSPVWGQLRQLIVYSQKPYGEKDINQSPLNVGIEEELDELNAQQVSAVARAAGLHWEQEHSEALMAMVGGHPYLVQHTLELMKRRDLSLETVLRTAPTEEGIYGKVLTERLQMLELIPSLREAMCQVVRSDKPVRLGGRESFKLAGMGLVRISGNDCVPRCRLYRLYFQDRLR